MVNLENEQVIAKGENSSFISVQTIRHSVMNCIDNFSKLKPKDENQLKTTKDNYLLYGLTMICIYEPCLMCAMALVHSRLKNLVFFKNNEFEDSPFSKSDIDFLKLNLNHKYSVYVYDESTKDLNNILNLNDK